MTVTEMHLNFDFYCLDYYYEWTTEYDGEDLPEEIEALLEIEADLSQGR
jgi:hypothetical protein